MIRLPGFLRVGPQFGVTQHHNHHPGAPAPAPGDAPAGGGVYFTEIVFYVAIFVIPVAIMFYMLGQPLMDWMETNILSEFEASAK